MERENKLVAERFRRQVCDIPQAVKGTDEWVEVYRIVAGTKLQIPSFWDSGICAGFPSPAVDYIQGSIDLNEELVENPSATFFADVHGQSMLGAFIADPCKLVIDRSKTPQVDDILLLVVDGEFIVRQYILENGKKVFIPRPAGGTIIYPTISPETAAEVKLWGVVAHIIVTPRIVTANARI